MILPCHNAAEFLADALQSVRDQTLGDFECLIVDDASTDNSRSIAQQFVEQDPHFRLIVLKQNRGASAARNAGIAEAKGRWIALLDADDLFVPDRLEVLRRIGDGERADLVFDDQVITTFPARTSARRAFGFRTPTFAFTQEDFFTGSRLFRRAFPAGYMKPLIRRDFLSRSGAAYDPAVPSGEDFLFYAQLFAQRPRCIGTSFAGYVYRRRRGSLSWSEEHLHFHAKLGEQVLSELGSQLSPRSRAALEARARDFEAVANVSPAMMALRQRDWLRLAASLVRRPSVVATGMRMLRARAVRALPAVRAPAPGRSG